MSTNETTPFMFDIQESLSFRADAHLQDLIGIALEPDISIQEFEHEISVRGIIELTGEYHPVQDVIEGTAVAVSPSTREMENVKKLESGTNTFYHRFPVEISIPKHRIKQLKDVYVAIDNFDYEIPGSNVLELHATVAIYGVRNEKRQAAEQLYNQTETVQEADTTLSYSDDIAEQLEAQAREIYQNEQQGNIYYNELQIEPNSDEAIPDTEVYQFSEEKYAKSEETELNYEEPTETREQQEQQAYTFEQEYTESAEEETAPEGREQQEQQAYTFNQEYTEQAEGGAASEQQAAEARDQPEQQAYTFNQEYTEQAGQEAASEQQAAEAREEQAQAYAFNQENTESAQVETAQEQQAAQVRDEQHIEAEQADVIDQPPASNQEQASSSPRVNIQAENKAAEAHEQEVFDLEDDGAPTFSKLPEELFVLADELEDAYQAADFRQAQEQYEDVYNLDRELPHEERTAEPDFTFTYQAKQTEEAPSEPITLEAPPLLTPEEDDRWKYKESKTFSEFFGSKPVEPAEVPQADYTEEEIEANEDASQQAVPINQELQPEDLQGVLVEQSLSEAEEAPAERRESGNFLVHMFGAREETFTKVRVCIVQERDTLEKIATRYDVPVSSITSSNNLEEETISEGQLLVIPQKRSKKS